MRAALIAVGAAVAWLAMAALSRSVGTAAYYGRGDAALLAYVPVAVATAGVAWILWPRQPEPPAPNSAAIMNGILDRERAAESRAKALLAIGGAAGAVGLLLMFTVESRSDPNRPIGLALFICAAICMAAGWFLRPRR